MKNLFFILSFVLFSLSCKKEEPAPEPAKHSVNYNGNGNTGGTVPVDGNKYASGASAVVLGNDGGLVKTGFTFMGWNSNSSGTETDFAVGSSLVIGSGDVNIYAKWFDNSSGSTFHVTYVGNGNSSGSVPVDNNAYAAGSIVTVAGNTGGLEKSGNSFKNWNTSQSGSGQSYSSGSQIVMQGNLTLYAIYNAPTSSGKYVGFNSTGQVKSKSSLTASWSTEDLNANFGSGVVAVVWNGSKYIGFNSSGQVKSKSSLTASWSTEDLNANFGSGLVAVVWNGSKYIGFNSSGQVKSKSSLTASWSSEDLNANFGSGLVAVAWNGSKYIGFNSTGQVKSKSSLTASWSTEDLNADFGSGVVAVVWNGSKYIGFNSTGQVKSKSSLTASWSTEDLNANFGSGVVAVVYN